MQVVQRFLDLLGGRTRASEPRQPLDLLDPAFLHDPYPTYAWLREHDPVHRMRNGGWMLTRHADIVAALANPDLGNAASRTSVLHARNRERNIAADVAGNILPFLDKPEHTLPRKLIAAAFRAQLKASPPRADEIAQHLLSPLVRTGRMDAMADYGKPLSVEVMSSLMGLPPSDGARLTVWSNFFFYLFAPIPSQDALRQMNDALGEFRVYFAALADERREAPANDLVSRLVHEEIDGKRLSARQVVDTCMLIFADGVENIDAALANMLLALKRHPQQLALLRKRPELVPEAVGEALRYDPAAQVIARIALRDMVLQGREIRRDMAVFLSLGSSSRDPAIFREPDRFMIGRDVSAALGFGRGRHSCIGAPLVRMQLEAALRVLCQSTSDFSVQDAGTDWFPRAGHRWLKQLPVELKPSRSFIAAAAG